MAGHLPRGVDMRVTGPEQIVNIQGDRPSPLEQHQLLEQGLELDNLGRPIHPWASTRLLEKDLAEGKGAFYHWGPNKTVDPIVVTSEAIARILLIQRADTGQWALPGGFVDPADQTIIAAAERELHEETSLSLGTVAWKLCYNGPVDDPRTTLHAWPATTALITRVKTAAPPIANDDAAHAEWVKLADIASMELYGSHKELIGLGLALR